MTLNINSLNILAERFFVDFEKNEDKMDKDINRRNFLQHSVAIAGGANFLDSKAASPKIHLEKAAQTNMPTSILGRTGRKVSRLGFGGGTPFWQMSKSEDYIEKLLEYSIQQGITYFDTAHSYGKDQASEKWFGKYVTPKHRDKIFLVTKTRERSYDGVMKEFEQSLINLNTDYLDLYHMHSLKTLEDIRTLLSPTGGFKAFRKLKEEGVIKNIGFSFHLWADFSKLAFEEFDPDVVMCSLNASRDSGCEEHFLSVAKKKNTGVVAMKVTAGNSLIGKISGQDLVRYSLSLPVPVVNIGIEGFGTLESCVNLAKENLLSKSERDKLNKKLAYSPESYNIPYHDPNYFDGYYA